MNKISVIGAGTMGHSIALTVAWHNISAYITGPLMSADFTGLDVANAISEYLYEDLCNHTKPEPTMTHFIENNQLGVKSGQGFYLWDREEIDKISERRERLLIEFLKIDTQKGE